MKISYTQHACERMKLRHVNKNDVVETLHNGAFHYVSPKKFKVHNGAIVLVVEETRKNKFTLITVLHGKKTKKEIRYKQKVFDFSYRKACRVALSM